MKKVGISIDFRSDPELFELLNKYRVSTGWTWKRLILIGIAEAVSKNKDNPDLALAVVDYLNGDR